MTLTFYYGSGSPYAWRVWLGLEHKQVPYEQKVLSFSAGDHRKPEFLAINPRHKVPVIIDDGFALHESSAILEYLDERFPDGPPLFPGDVRARAIARRLIREADTYVMESSSDLTGELFSTKPAADWDQEKIAGGKQKVLEELARFEGYLTNEWLAGPRVSAADLSLYPMLATLGRLEKKKPDLGLLAALPPKVAGWFERFKALPYADKTYPPHWR